MKLKNIITWILIIIAVIIIGGGTAFYFAGRDMQKTLSEIQISDVDVNRIPDGVYEGSYAKFLVAATVQVTVQNHTITNINVIKQRAHKKYKALEILKRVIEARSLEIDTVTGATGSSKALLMAISKALQSADSSYQK